MIFIRRLIFPSAVLCLAIFGAGLLCLIVGERPSVIFEALRTTLGTGFGWGFVLYYFTPLLLTGLSVSIAFHAGLFNIGAEGQLYLGALGVLLCSVCFPNLPSYMAVPCGILAAGMFGGAWAAFAGFLKAYRGSHEVIVTILMNFIAIALVNFVILNPLHNPDSQNPESRVIPEAYRIPPLSNWVPALAATPVNCALLLALLVALLAGFFLFRTLRGFELRAVGKSHSVSRLSGISVKKETVLAFFLSGMVAGLVGVNEVMGYQHRVIEGFSPQYGFTGIAVALLGRNRPVGVILSALLFSVLHNMSREVEFLSDRISKELSSILEAMVIAMVATHWIRKWLASDSISEEKTA